MSNYLDALKKYFSMDPSDYFRKLEEVYRQDVLNDGLLEAFATGLCTETYLLDRLKALKIHAAATTSRMAVEEITGQCLDMEDCECDHCHAEREAQKDREFDEKNSMGYL